MLSLALPKEGYTAERLHHMFGSAEQNINFPTPIPVHLTYQTAFVDDDGRLEFREDMYGRDQVLIAILRGEEPKIAESPVDRREGYSAAEVLLSIVRAVIVYERRLVGQMHRQVVRELNVLLLEFREDMVAPPR